VRHKEHVSAAALKNQATVMIEKVQDESTTVTFRVAHESLRQPVELCFAGDVQASEVPSLFEQAQKVRLRPLCRVRLVIQIRRFELSFGLPLSELDPADGILALTDSPERPRPGPGMLDAFQLDAAQYEKVREFGRNSTSRLVRKWTRDEIVLKTIDVSRSQDARRDLARLSRLSHNCIARIIGVALDAENDPTIRVATRFCRSGSLADLLERQSDETNNAKAIVGILLGMRYLHGNFPVHGNLKPTNVLIDEQPVRICDVGLSRVQGVEVVDPAYRGIHIDVIRLL
jgi:serine/threonine protein kinase